MFNTSVNNEMFLSMFNWVHGITVFPISANLCTLDQLLTALTRGLQSFVFILFSVPFHSNGF